MCGLSGKEEDSQAEGLYLIPLVMGIIGEGLSRRDRPSKLYLMAPVFSPASPPFLGTSEALSQITFPMVSPSQAA